MEELAKGFARDFVGAIQSLLVGWIPDWVWSAIGLWPYIAWAMAIIIAVGVFHRVYQLGGWPALAAATGAAGVALGYFLGIRHKPKTVAPIPVVVTKPKKRRRPTIFNMGG